MSHRLRRVLHSNRWLFAGLIGGCTLSIATVHNFLASIHVLILGDGEIDWREGMGVFGLVFLLGFICGVVVWCGRGLSKKMGWFGDAILGVVCLNVFFTGCMLAFSPELLHEKRGGGLVMLSFASAIGIYGGITVGRDIRREIADWKNG